MDMKMVRKLLPLVALLSTATLWRLVNNINIVLVLEDTEITSRRAANTENGSFELMSSVETQPRSPLCNREQIREGSWMPTTMPRPPYVTKTKHLRCYPSEHYKQSPWSTFEWLPTDQSCELSTWNAVSFCRLLKYTTISIIGDSLSWEQYSSLLQLLGARVHQTSQHTSKEEDRNHIQVACEGTVKFVWRNDAYLSKVADSLAEDFPMVLVLNRGAHYVNDTDFASGMQDLLPSLVEWQETCQRRQLRCHLFWRSSVPGHPGCHKTNWTTPVNDLDTMEALIADRSIYNNVTLQYHWYDFKHQNELALSALEYSGLEYDVIDAYHLNLRRPDEHRVHQNDCLHNCYPGKMDVYNRLLLHFIRMHRTQEDIDAVARKFQEYVNNSAATN